jgi:hypothetical protein
LTLKQRTVRFTVGENRLTVVTLAAGIIFSFGTGVALASAGDDGSYTLKLCNHHSDLFLEIIKDYEVIF